jgi:hemerythrin-like domain-containing protein
MVKTMTGPIEMLMEEHRNIEKVLAALSRFAAGTAGEGEADRETVAMFAEFFRSYADACHHGKEEDLLFVEMTRAGMPADGGPIAIMLQEHKMGRELVGELAAIGRGSGPLTQDELADFRRASGDFVDLLSEHIKKEDGALYPMAEQILPEAVFEDLQSKFNDFEQNRVGDKMHEHMSSLAGSLLTRAAAQE